MAIGEIEMPVKNDPTPMCHCPSSPGCVDVVKATMGMDDEYHQSRGT